MAMTPQQMTDVVNALIETAERSKSRRHRFPFFASSLPDPVLVALIEAADALSHDNYDHRFTNLLYKTAISTRGLIYPRTALADAIKNGPGVVKGWGLSVGLALILERNSRLRPEMKVRIPPDPFSKVQMSGSLNSIATQMNNQSVLPQIDKEQIGREGWFSGMMKIIGLLIVLGAGWAAYHFLFGRTWLGTSACLLIWFLLASL